MIKTIKSSFRFMFKYSPLISKAIYPNQGLKHKFVFSEINYNSRFYFSNAHQNVSKSSYQGEGFYMEQLLTGCLSLYSYYIQSGNQAFLIDPLNETQKYDQIIESRGKTLKGVFLTHYHADYIAGHIELQKKYKCNVYMGPTALDAFGVKVLKDNQILKLGKISLKLVHTPGHTEESSCLLLTDAAGKDECLFTGDTLFLNQVGRPDLAVKSNLTAEDLANKLFESLQKLKSNIGDSVRIYPGHGAGSSCGKNIGKGDFCTMGTQKTNNYALNSSCKKDFVMKVLDDMPQPPQYFKHDAGINKFSPFDYNSIQQIVSVALTSDEVKNMMKTDSAKVIDVRSVQEIQKEGFIKNTINIDFNGGFASWVGTLLSPKGYYIIYGPKQKAEESIKRLLRIGYTNIGGYCCDNIKQMTKNFEVYDADFAPTIPYDNRTILDVRKKGEWKKGIAADAEVVKHELSSLFKEDVKLDKSKRYLIHCAGGFRARIAFTFLKNAGYNVKVFAHGGFEDFEKLGIKIKNAQ